MARYSNSDTCPHCGSDESALRMTDGAEELIWCASCFRIWFRPDELARPEPREARSKSQSA